MHNVPMHNVPDPMCTKNPAQFDMNGNNSVVKDCQESLYLTTDCKQYFPVFQMRFTKSAGVITRGDMG